jgi:hypothetical protein
MSWTKFYKSERPARDRVALRKMVAGCTKIKFELSYLIQCIHITDIFNELLQRYSGMPKIWIWIFVLNKEVIWSSHGTKNGGSGMHENQIWPFTPNRTDRTYNRHLRRRSTSTHDDCGMPKNWIQIFVPISRLLAWAFEHSTSTGDDGTAQHDLDRMAVVGARKREWNFECRTTLRGNSLWVMGA